jgi:hypothetical protein
LSALDSVLPIQAKKIVEQATNEGLCLRLVGALAVRTRSITSNSQGFNRKLSDLDFMGYSKQRKHIERFFKERNYFPNEKFNYLHGDRRLIFFHPDHEFQVDVFLDIFEMAHTFDMRGRLELDSMTIPLADLVATKLQIVQLNEKDVKDLLALIQDHDLADDDKNSEKINTAHLARLCAKDWGVYKTFTLNLAKLNELLTDYVAHEQSDLVKSRLRDLSQAIEAKPKSLGWKIRAKVGEKKIWYQVPDVRSYQPAPQDQTKNGVPRL